MCFRKQAHREVTPFNVGDKQLKPIWIIMELASDRQVALDGGDGEAVRRYATRHCGRGMVWRQANGAGTSISLLSTDPFTTGRDGDTCIRAWQTSGGRS